MNEDKNLNRHASLFLGLYLRLSVTSRNKLQSIKDFMLAISEMPFLLLRSSPINSWLKLSNTQNTKYYPYGKYSGQYGWSCSHKCSHPSLWWWSRCSFLTGHIRHLPSYPGTHSKPSHTIHCTSGSGSWTMWTRKLRVWLVSPFPESILSMFMVTLPAGLPKDILGAPPTSSW